MRTATLAWTAPYGWDAPDAAADADLVLYFGDRTTLADGACHAALRAAAPGALLLGCSAAGHLGPGGPAETGAVAAALRFEGTGLRLASRPVSGPADSVAAGAALGEALAAPDLAGILLLADGLAVAGAALAAGLSRAVGPGVPVTGGLAADGEAFSRTLVAADAPARPGLVAALGFYGPRCRFGHALAGGWDGFGPLHRITRAEHDEVMELDGEAALPVYAGSLGPDAAALPGAGLRFPLLVWDPAAPGEAVVRSVLGVDRTRGSLRFAGTVPEGWRAQLLRFRQSRLEAAAATAARAAGRGGQGSLALLTSCIGRKLAPGAQASAEFAAIGAALGPLQRRIGFYAYGQFAPHPAAGGAALHNQSLVVTLLDEDVRC
ncbi:FIST signal transduction protein [Siccirubricoccus phaeus]|uniref:FIST signal transduction protein n=1 Tax=Siccirubricoccus phaeus TaxID=2595053 RepID=UPI0011F2965F|nr:FIST N-terminal domain-containing protein [Siccirubricoccus phaeus]